MSGRPSFQSERSFQSSQLPNYGSSTRQPSSASASGQRQAAATAWPHSISSVMSQPSGSSLLFSPSALQNLNPLRPAATAGSRNAASRGTPAATVPLSQLPDVTKADFEPYLSEIKEEYALWEKQLSLTSKKKQSRSPSLSSTWSNMPGTSNSARAQIMPDLTVVPQLFMDKDFDLTLPRTFDQVTQLSPVPTTNSPGAAGPDRPKLHSRTNSFTNMTFGDIASDQMLQEKLSHYLDVVEQHLALEIASRSSTFFSALSNLQALHSQSETALVSASDLKRRLASINHFSKSGIKAIRMALRRHRLEKLKQAASAVQELLRAVREAGALAAAGEWEGALGLVEEVQSEYPASTHPDGTLREVRLDRVQALHDLPNRLTGLKRQIASSLRNELLSVLMHQLHEHTESYSRQAKELGADYKWEASEAKEQASEAARPLVRGLARCGPGLQAVEDMASTWRESVLSAVQSVIAKHLPGEPETAEQSAALQELSHQEFLQLCRDVYRELQGLLNVLQALTEIVDALSTDASSSLSGSVASSHLAEDLQDIVYAAAELCNARFSKAFVSRTETHTSQLALPEFVILFKESWNFVLFCEVMCKRMIVGLRGVLVSQSKAFLASFHRKSVERSAKVVEEEQWTPAEIPSETQAIVNRIVEGAMADPKELILVEKGCTEPNGDANNANTNGHSALAKTLNVEDHTYHAVGACLKCLDMLQDYLKIVINITLLTTDAMGRIIEFLKQFNSRTCQLVLGAGALRSAGLKNITAKHLALASQTISILIALIPYIRELLRRHLSPRQAVMLIDFDKLKRDLQDHLNEINDKLVSIMGDRLTIHCKTLHSIDWSAEPDQQSPDKPNAYMESLVKETMTLHKVLSRFMPGQALELVMMQVLSAITSRLAEEYSKLDLPDLKAKQRLAGDARYLRQRLGDLKGLERTVPGGELETLVQDLTTREQPELPPKDTTEAPQPEESPPKVQSPAVSQDAPLPSPTQEVGPPRVASPPQHPTSNVKNRLGALFRNSSMRRSFSSESQASASPTQTQQPALPSPTAQVAPTTDEGGAAGRPSLDIPEADEDSTPMPVMPSPSAATGQSLPLTEAPDEKQSEPEVTAQSPKEEVGRQLSENKAEEKLESPAKDANEQPEQDQTQEKAESPAEEVEEQLPKAASTLSVPDIIEPGNSTEDLALIGDSQASAAEAEAIPEEPKEEQISDEADSKVAENEPTSDEKQAAAVEEQSAGEEAESKAVPEEPKEEETSDEEDSKVAENEPTSGEKQAAAVEQQSADEEAEAEHVAEPEGVSENEAKDAEEGQLSS